MTRKEIVKYLEDEFKMLAQISESFGKHLGSRHIVSQQMLAIAQQLMGENGYYSSMRKKEVIKYLEDELQRLSQAAYFLRLPEDFEERIEVSQQIFVIASYLLDKKRYSEQITRELVSKFDGKDSEGTR